MTNNCNRGIANFIGMQRFAGRAWNAAAAYPRETGRAGAGFVVFLVALVLVAGLYVWAGGYDVAADTPHWTVTAKLIEGARDLSVMLRSRGIRAPGDLDAGPRITRGAGLYDEMCVGCHLAPGKEESELRQGLNPQPPDLPRDGIDESEETFWIVKHGIKLTAMPAWGKSHTDEQIWDMVAFLRHIQGMDPARYRALVAAAPPDEHHEHEAHEHGDHHVR